MLAAGLLVSGAWFGIAILLDGRRCGVIVELAASFASEPLQTASQSAGGNVCSRAQDWMHYLILLVIAVFMAMYLGLGFMRLS